MHLLHAVDRVEEVGLAGAGRTAAHVHAADRPASATTTVHPWGAARPCSADAQARDVGEPPAGAPRPLRPRPAPGRPGPRDPGGEATEKPRRSIVIMTPPGPILAPDVRPAGARPWRRRDQRGRCPLRREPGADRFSPRPRRRAAVARMETPMATRAWAAPGRATAAPRAGA